MLSEKLLNQLPLTAALYGLDIQETEELTAWASTVTESPLQNSSQQLERLLSGLQELQKTTNSQYVVDAAITSLVQASSNVRYAVVVRRVGKPTQVIAYMGRG